MSQLKPTLAGRERPAWSGRPSPASTPESRASKRLGSYLRKLREGYGYTLRKVEERALALGESIDNSQLSRFEKGKAVPSFEKLRALAKIFNVSVQNFSDVLDLEEYADLKPDAGEFQALILEGTDLHARGEYGRAFVTYERAFEIASEIEDDGEAAERISEARWRMASALKALGKLTLTEAELRAIFRHRKRLGPRTRLRCLLDLSQVHRQLGDLYLAGVLCKECLELAVEDGDVETQAHVLNNLGSICHDDGEPAQALEYFRRALELLEGLGYQKQRLIALINLGGCLVSVHRFDDGVAKLREAYSEARRRGFRRMAALSSNRLAEAYVLRGDDESAREHIVRSDGLASKAGESYHDILFANAFLRWRMARERGNSTGENVAFGQLRRLRSRLERKFPEVQEFDDYVERGRR